MQWTKYKTYEENCITKSKTNVRLLIF